MKQLPLSFVKTHRVIITKQNDDETVLGTCQPLSLPILAEIQRVIPGKIAFKTISQEDFNRHLSTAFEADASSALAAAEDFSWNNLESWLKELPKTEDLLDPQTSAPVIRLLNALLSEAIRQYASDIHLETTDFGFLVRLRVDGVLREVLRSQQQLAPLLVSRVKVMAKLDIAEKRLPQDGRFSVTIAGKAIDLRVSVIPTNHGERVVLRILDKQAVELNFHALGLSTETQASLRSVIAKPYGIILVTGPTGSGKTTTLYAALSELNRATRNILTIEDPIEYHLPGVGQMQVNAKINMTFANGLRAILRQDPDVVMIGEIRDAETAKIAVQASLTGHLVLSTLHTNTALGAVTRLQDIGVEPFLLSSSLLALAAQRLVRVLCRHCKIPHDANPRERQLLEISDKQSVTLYSAVGCTLCQGTGYSGRSGIYEFIVLDEHMRQLIHDSAPESEMIHYARENSLSMRQDGYRVVLAGNTTLEEVVRVS